MKQRNMSCFATIALDLVFLLLVKSTSWSFTIDAKVPRPSKGLVGFVISSLSPPKDIKNFIWW